MIRADRMYPFDYIVLGYCALMAALILVFGRPFIQYLDELAFYVGAAMLAIFIPRVLDEHRSRSEAFIRLLYPALLLWPFYRMTQGTILLVFDNFFDADLSAFEVSILGADPSLYFDSHGLNVVVTEILSLCYFSYYFMIPAFFLPVFFRRDYRILKEALAVVCLTFFASYLLFALYPIEGPRWHFAGLYQHPVEGPLFRQLVNFVIDSGAVHGGCMPSSHTAVGLVLMLMCFRYYRRWGWVLLPFVIGLAAGTVWGRFHFASDVVVGAAIACAAYWLINKYHDRWINRPENVVADSKMQGAHVS
ncbi:MAG: phosphatase PAP2 family protein [candidate division Zixibacteria bacterium]|nr:phosphatase PAP2 family protein [candidate division Zixibacteria bacterium]